MAGHSTTGAASVLAATTDDIGSLYEATVYASRWHMGRSLAADETWRALALLSMLINMGEERWQ